MSGSPSTGDVMARDCANTKTTYVEGQGQPTKWKLQPVNGVPSALLCSACGGLLVEPIQSTCGERFCQECFKAIVKYGILVGDVACDAASGMAKWVVRNPQSH